MKFNCKFKLLILRLHLSEDELKIVFAEEKTYQQKQKIFDSFDEVEGEIRNRTHARVKDTKGVR